MGEVYFYHLTRSPLDIALAQLLGRARQAGWRIAVRGVDDARLRDLDLRLWQVGEAGDFLAHGVAGGPHDAQQPILLTTEVKIANAAQCVMTIDGAELDPAEVRGIDRACVLFDGTDAAALDRARAQWKTLTDAGCGAKYWSQDSGSWEMRHATEEKP